MEAREGENMGLCINYTKGHCTGFDPELCINRCGGEFGADDCATTLYYLLEQCKTERDNAKTELYRVSYQKEKIQKQMLDSGECLQNTINARDNEIKALNARLAHLLESDYIKQFDRVDPETREYAKPIREADANIATLKEAVDELYKLNADLIERIHREPEPAQPERPKVFYVCDRRACERCDPECIYTSDIRHAENFELKNDTMIERKTVDISDIGRALKKL